jgi:hypothetical protein
MVGLRKDGLELRSSIRCESVLKKPPYFDLSRTCLTIVSSLAVGAEAEFNPSDC